jgi:hypothetical protein
MHKCLFHHHWSSGNIHYMYKKGIKSLVLSHHTYLSYITTNEKVHNTVHERLNSQPKAPLKLIDFSDFFNFLQ